MALWDKSEHTLNWQVNTTGKKTQKILVSKKQHTQLFTKPANTSLKWNINMLLFL